MRRIEHKLSATITDHIREAREAIGQLETQYLAAMGQARETQIEILARRRELNNTLALVVKMERLPASSTGYSLNTDNTALVGETADVPAEIQPRGAFAGNAGIPAHVPELEPGVPADAGNLAEAQTRGYVNGAPHGE